ncbi:hypothetical protein D3C80_2013780 [compost metagenome]
MVTKPVCLGCRVMIQRVARSFLPLKVPSWLICRVPSTSKSLSRGVRSGLPNRVGSEDSRVSSTVSPSLKRVRSTLAVKPAA